MFLILCIELNSVSWKNSDKSIISKKALKIEYLKNKLEKIYDLKKSLYKNLKQDNK